MSHGRHTGPGRLLHEQGEVEQARVWYGRAAEAGNTNAVRDLVQLVSDGDQSVTESQQSEIDQSDD
ncbi:hypothetical protein ACWCQN_43955 [Streptomyces sp. NPDC001984]|uniref:hypothetical protein n=1 Tax=Streptomyces sp. NPDC002619 TaxID=3364655 RepID=UPI00367A37BF